MPLLSFAFRWELAEELAIKDPENPTVQLLQGNEMTFATEIGSPDGEKLRVHRLGYKVSGRDFALTRKEKSNQYQLSPTQQEEELSLYPYTRSLHGIYLRLLSSTGSRTKPSHTIRTALFSRTYSMNWKSSSPGSITWDRYGNTPSDAMYGRGASRLMSGRRGERAVDAILAARERNNYIHRGRHKQSLDTRSHACVLAEGNGLDP